MTKELKQLRHLNTTLLHWAEENKIKSRKSGQTWELPPQFRKDFKFVTRCDLKVAHDKDKLTREEMKQCNKIYRFYRKVYNKMEMYEAR
tara:strand:+ start:46 stop:312 length:267 start_codon:yes stop_codon:yes gene_type:complete